MRTLLAEADALMLRGLPLTYDGVSGTLADTVPSGYRGFTRSRLLAQTNFSDAAERLMTWQVHEAAGLRVSASARRVSQDTVVQMRLGVGPASLKIPCRVVHVVERHDAVGFAYGTLLGHPESGEELFMLERAATGVTFTIRAFSRPGTIATRLAGPIGRGFQHLMTSRYLAAADPS